MRRALVAAVAVLTSGSFASPVAASPVPAPEAMQTIAAACAASRLALVSGGSVTTASSRLVLAADRFEVGGVSPERLVAADTGTYGSIVASGLHGKDQKKALRYLKRPAAKWWLNAGRFETAAQGWSATFEQARDAALTLDGSCAQLLQGDFDVDRNGNTWTFTSPPRDPFSIVTTDDGRLLQLADIAIDYAAFTVELPSATVAFRAWQRACQAASLNWTLRSLARQVAEEVNNDGPTVPAIDDAVGRALPSDRVVAMKVRQLRKGSLIYARDPYTKAYHAWRVYLKHGRAVARRVAP